MRAGRRAVAVGHDLAKFTADGAAIVQVGVLGKLGVNPMGVGGSRRGPGRFSLNFSWFASTTSASQAGGQPGRAYASKLRSGMRPGNYLLRRRN